MSLQSSLKYYSINGADQEGKKKKHPQGRKHITMNVKQFTPNQPKKPQNQPNQPTPSTPPKILLQVPKMQLSLLRVKSKRETENAVRKNLHFPLSGKLNKRLNTHQNIITHN